MLFERGRVGRGSATTSGSSDCGSVVCSTSVFVVSSCGEEMDSVVVTVAVVGSSGVVGVSSLSCKSASSSAVNPVKLFSSPWRSIDSVRGVGVGSGTSIGAGMGSCVSVFTSVTSPFCSLDGEGMLVLGRV